MTQQARHKISKPRPRENTSVAEMVESIIGCKWSLQVLAAIRQGIHRPGELQRSCEGISTKVLNERLRKLTRFGMLDRVSHPEVPPRVEYSFTSFGEQFLEVLDDIDRLQQKLDTDHRLGRTR